MKTSFQLSALFCSICFAVTCFAQNETAKKQRTPATKQFDAIMKKYNDDSRRFREEYKQAETDKDRVRIQKEKAPNGELYVKELLKVAEKHPNDPGSVKALNWVFLFDPAGKHADHAFDLLDKNHIESDAIANLCHDLPSITRSPRMEPWLRKVILRNKNEKALAFTTLSLGNLLKRNGEYGEAEQFFEAALKYTNVKTIRGSVAKVAENCLFELRHLIVGKTAPEIEGVDVNGVKFKLSDYRGKVVVIDFWGDW